MNALTDPAGSPALLDIIDLKWLLAGDGHRVHVERVLNDPEYARRCLLLALGSPNEAAQRAARRLAERLGLPLDQPSS